MINIVNGFYLLIDSKVFTIKILQNYVLMHICHDRHVTQRKKIVQVILLFYEVTFFCQNKLIPKLFRLFLEIQRVLSNM